MLKRIADALPLPVPRPGLYEPETCPPFAVHRRVEGTVLTRSAWERLAPGARARVAEQLAGSLPAGVLARLPDLLAQAVDANEPLALLHADLAPGHVLHDDGTPSSPGVIDFGDVALGPPARDFIFLHEDFGPSICAEVLRAYAARSPALSSPRPALLHA